MKDIQMRFLFGFILGINSIANVLIVSDVYM